MKLEKYLKCNKCNSADLSLSKFLIYCNNCESEINITNGIPRYVNGEYHSNFGLQWNKFSKVQLDSVNGSKESEDRLRLQSKLDLKLLSGKTILEVGAGNGRFTEIFLKYGARVISVDYSSAIDANLSNHESHMSEGNFFPIQADLFNLPIKTESFDMVFCYGVIQHTGNNKRAIWNLSKFPTLNGRLFLDIYSNGLKHFNPLIYLIRPFFSIINVSEHRRLEIVENFVGLFFPLQLKILRLMHARGGIIKILRYIINRSPNSVYGINLYLDNKINLDTAYQWCVMDTFDAWAPKHDHPVSKKKWAKFMAELVDNGYRVDDIGLSGQGHTAALTRKKIY